jgi:probable addiction module antidote protein
MALYFAVALEEKDAALIAAVLGDMARAKGMAQIAEKTGLRRTSLYKALSPDGHPEFEMILKVVDALGLELCVTPIKA